MLKETNFEMIGSFFLCMFSVYAQIIIELNEELDYLTSSVVSGTAIAFFILLAFPKMKCHFTPLITISEVMFKGLPVSDGTYSFHSYTTI
jgi:glycerol uptake facilitator-like aquaporin